MIRRNGNLKERSTGLHEDTAPAGNGMRVRERTITKKCLKWASEAIPDGAFYKRYAGPNRRGQPDISGCIDSVRVEIEMKAPGNKPTTLQQHWIDKWAKAGAISGWADSLEGFQRIIIFGFFKKRGVFLDSRLFKKFCDEDDCEQKSATG